MATEKITQNVALNNPTEMVKKKAREIINPKENLLQKVKNEQSSMMKSFKEAKKGYNIDQKA
ncbi:MAG: hypothetical protein JXA07_11885 [Spirochaetes bacterium]|nr:hypothetical protein [Spirochaetota bacterium]